jgi:(R)-2-hydroxyacyl-CoA dehydratese activating ATPase
MCSGRELSVEGGPGSSGSLPSPHAPLPTRQGFEKGGASGPDFLGKLMTLRDWGRGIGGGGKGPPALSPLPQTNQTALGLDFGSRYVKLVYGREGRFTRRRLDSLDFYRDFLDREQGRLRIDWERLGLEQPAALVATGYGKDLLKGLAPAITEIRAIFLGARFLTGLDHFILLEMGGQDTKVLYVKDGRVFDFVTNDRCAAGTGRYLENMARFLKIPLRDFSGYWEEPVAISQTCAIFGESELIGHLLEGVPLARLAAGINASVSRRALTMMHRYACPRLVFVGGVARNRAVIHFLREGSSCQVQVLPHPQFTGALGCCLEALKILRTEPS